MLQHIRNCKLIGPTKKETCQGRSWWPWKRSGVQKISGTWFRRSIEALGVRC